MNESMDKWTNDSILRLCCQCNHLLGRVFHAASNGEVQTRFPQNVLSLFDVRSFQPYHHRHLDPEVAHGRHHAAGHDVAAHDAAKDVDQHRAYVGIAEDDLEATFHLLLAGAAAHVEEVGGAAARVLDDVHGGHGETGPIHHAAHVAVEPDVVQAVLARLHFQRVFFVQVTQFADVGVAEEGVIVKVHLGVERQHAPVFGHHQRVDLRQRGVSGLEGAGEAGQELHRLAHLAAL